MHQEDAHFEGSSVSQRTGLKTVSAPDPCVFTAATTEAQSNSASPMPGLVTGLACLNILAGAIVMFAASQSDRPHEYGLVIVGFICIALGVGLLLAEPWARIAAIVGYGLNAVIYLHGGYWIPAVISIWLTGYFASARVKAAFTPRGEAESIARIPAEGSSTLDNTSRN
ncbi:MAG: hypothetical protein ACRERU_11550 [Methylococcales bacterium]